MRKDTFSFDRQAFLFDIHSEYLELSITTVSSTIVVDLEESVLSNLAANEPMELFRKSFYDLHDHLRCCLSTKTQIECEF